MNPLVAAAPDKLNRLDAVDEPASAADGAEGERRPREANEPVSSRAAPNPDEDDMGPIYLVMRKTGEVPRKVGPFKDDARLIESIEEAVQLVGRSNVTVIQVATACGPDLWVSDPVEFVQIRQDMQGIRRAARSKKP